MTIGIVWSDMDCLQVEIRTWNERFMGTTRAYIGLDGPGQFANSIAGFPSGIGDQRSYEFGSRGDSSYCHLTFKTTDGAGHCIIEVDIKEQGSYAGLSIPVEAAAVDRFVEQLRAMDAAGKGEAVIGL